MLTLPERYTLGLTLTKGRWAYVMEAEYGGGILPTITNDNDHVYRLAGGRIEARYELWPPDPIFVQRRWHYVGLQVGYRDYHRELFDRDYVAADEVKISFDRAIQTFTRYEAIVNYTLRLPVSDRLWVEGFTGLGAALRTVDYRDVINQRETDLFKEVIASAIFPGLGLYDDTLPEGTRLVPAYRLGFRVSYLLSPAR